jgi:hypothetical protein
VEDGTYFGQFSSGCLERGGVIRVDSVGETPTANESVQRNEKFIVVNLSPSQDLSYAAFCRSYHKFPPSSPPSRPWCNELPGNASVCEVVGCSRVVEDGTYLGQFSSGCLERGGVIRVDGVEETPTANESVQRHEKFIDGHVR